MYNGSVTPRVEFKIIRGSKINNAAPIIENSFETNLLQKKYKGIIVNVETVILKIFCNILNVRKSVSLKNIKKKDKNHDHPSLFSKTFFGILYSVTTLYEYT